jgi:alkanesulfonate monooxygenase SsuD/methylene tetrahydromethanopterin reductase-like flavin-dependent oxidoreductase (luciferase family)
MQRVGERVRSAADAQTRTSKYLAGFAAYLHTHFTTDLPDNIPHSLPQFPLQHLVAILGDPDDVIAMVKNRMTAGAVGQTLLSKLFSPSFSLQTLLSKLLKLRLKPVSV